MNFLFSVPRWWILHVPRGWQETRGHCSGQVSGTPGRPEQADPFHQVRGEELCLRARWQYLFVCRFRLACHGRDSTTSYLPVTVFIQDINDNPPVFQSQGLYNCRLQHPWLSTGGLLLQRNSLDIHRSGTQSVKSQDKSEREERNILCKLIRRHSGIVSSLSAGIFSFNWKDFFYVGNFLEFETFSSCRQLKSFYNLLCFYCQYNFPTCLHAILDWESEWVKLQAGIFSSSFQCSIS